MSPTLRRKEPFFFLFAWKKKYFEKSFFFFIFFIRKLTLKLLLLQHLCTQQEKKTFSRKKKGNCIAQYFINLKRMVLMMIRARPKVCKTHFDFFFLSFFFRIVPWRLWSNVLGFYRKASILSISKWWVNKFFFACKSRNAQWGYFGIFLLFRFYVKTILENLEVLRLLLLPFLGLLILLIW